MKRILIAGVCAAALLLGTAPNAYATTPDAGTYWGYSEFGGHVVRGKIESPDHWKFLVVRTCDRTYRFVHKHINDEGSFVGRRKDDEGNVVFTIVAKFDDSDIAWGNIENPICGGGTAVYTELQS